MAANHAIAAAIHDQPSSEFAYRGLNIVDLIGLKIGLVDIDVAELARAHCAFPSIPRCLLQAAENTAVGMLVWST